MNFTEHYKQAYINTPVLYSYFKKKQTSQKVLSTTSDRQ